MSTLAADANADARVKANAKPKVNLQAKVNAVLTSNLIPRPRQIVALHVPSTRLDQQRRGSVESGAEADASAKANAEAKVNGRRPIDMVNGQWYLPLANANEASKAKPTTSGPMPR